MAHPTVMGTSGVSLSTGPTQPRHQTPIKTPSQAKNEPKMKNAWVSQILTLNMETVFGHKRCLKCVVRPNDWLYVELAGYPHPMVGTRSPGNPNLGPSGPVFGFYKSQCLGHVWTPSIGRS